MLIASGVGTGRTCPVCGEAHAVCGPVGAGTPVDIPVRSKGSAGMAPTGRTEKETRWINYNGSWRVFKITQDDPRYADSAPYDADADDNGRPDARLTGADVREGRTVADVEQRLADDKQAAELQREAAARNADDAGGKMRSRGAGGEVATNADGVLSDADEQYGDDVNDKARRPGGRSGSRSGTGASRRGASTTSDSKEN